MSDLSFQYYMQIPSDELAHSFRDRMEQAGYTAFYAFIEEFRDGLRCYHEEDIELFAQLLNRGRSLFPDPARFSPAWSRIWEHYDTIYHSKNAALSAVSPTERQGDWQVLIDNPFVTQQVVCYPDLSFMEAAYLYGYFKWELKPHEVLRLQKVCSRIEASGDARQSMLPE